ncbi:MAG: ankyrin repeat domain-containing protein, partial [Planctomycetota bacterium]
ASATTTVELAADEEPTSLTVEGLDGLDWMDAPEPEVVGLAALDSDESEFALTEQASAEPVPTPESAPESQAQKEERRSNGGDQVLLAAAERGETELVRMLLGGGTPTTVRDRRRATIGWTPLMLAVVGGHTDAVSLLLEAGADVDATDDPDRENEATVRDLARTTTADDIAARELPLGRTALHLAVLHGYPEITRGLLNAGCSVDVDDYLGERPLMAAAQSGTMELARLLLERGADVDARDVRGCGPLERAAMMGHSDMVGRLVEGGVTIDSRDTEGRTPLMYAVGGAHYDSARLLLEAGADPKSEATSGFGVLCAAICARGYFPDAGGELVVRPFPEENVQPVVELLLRWGADDSMDSTGLRPSHRAEGLGYFGVVRVLYDYSGEEYREAG